MVQERRYHLDASTTQARTAASVADLSPRLVALAPTPGRTARHSSVRASRDPRCDRDQSIVVLQPDINPAAIPGRPDSMRQFANGDRRDLGEVVGAEDLNLV